MGRSVGEIIDDLVFNENYVSVRSRLTDDFMALVKDMFSRDYKRIEDKENAYQELMKNIIE